MILLLELQTSDSERFSISSENNEADKADKLRTQLVIEIDLDRSGNMTKSYY